MEMLTFLVRSCTRESISKKRHVTVFMALSIGTIYQELSFTKYLNFTKKKEEIANVYKNAISVFK